jgi:hypothetical protein
MKPKTPFQKPPTSQFRRPDFYWRGGDVLREREYLSDEYRKALTEMRKAEQELLRVRAQVENATATLRERDGYTCALAGFMDGDTEGFHTENDLKEELVQLEQAIAEHEKILKQKHATHNPGVAGTLQKEKAYYLIDIERQMKAIENFDDEKQAAKRVLAVNAISPKFRTAIYLEFQLDKVKRKRRYLRALVNQSKAEFDSKKSVTAGQSPEARTCRIAMQHGIDLTMELYRAKEKLERRPQKHAAFLNFLIEQCEDLHTWMVENQIEDDAFDAVKLRLQYLGGQKSGDRDIENVENRRQVENVQRQRDIDDVEDQREPSVNNDASSQQLDDVIGDAVSASDE